MGDAQSAQPEGRKDAVEEDESGTVDDASTEQNIEDQSLKNKGQISEIHEKADGSKAEVNGHCEDEIVADAVLPPDEDVSQTETPLEEETPLENVEINEKESPNEADANEDITLEMTEMDAKQNDINESFRRFFSNIGLKLTVKRGSGEIPTDVLNDTDKEESNRPEDVEDTTKETTSENAEQNTDVNIAQVTYDNDSTTCPTLTDITSEDVLENAEENATENKVEVESNNADAAMTSPRGEDANQDTTTEEEPRSTSPSSLEEEEVASPIKRFFTTGIFSGLRKKKKLAEHETTDKEMKEIGKKEDVEKTEQTVEDQQQDTEDVSLGVDAAAVETEHDENKLKGEILSAAQKMDASPDPSTTIVTEPEVLSSQEKDKVQASPLKRLLSGSSLRKLSKKQRSRKSSDAKLSDSGEHVSDQLLSSTETAENQKEEGCAQTSTETVGEEDGAWASFKKLLTPKKRMKKSSLSNEETQMPGSVEEPKPSEGGQMSDHSTEENKKRKDSSVSWDSVLCRSGRRRSRKTSDSDDERPIIDNIIDKQDCGSKHGAESALENEVDEILAYSPKQAGSPSEGDGASTWKSLKRLVTPKRKAKDDDESKDNVQSDGEVTQDDSSFSIKKLLPGRKKRKSAEKQDQVSSDEADKEAASASGDEDSDTPAVVPLSEFDTVETEVHIQTQACVESNLPKEADFELQQDRLYPMAEPVLPCDNLQTEAKKVQGNDDASENQATTTPATNEKSDDLTESSSKQQLSDIPEEATPASVTEDVARDDTIAEDLIEITSEAITAAEHLDITLEDETEMISAVSQLSSESSSKTSGNTTPVPAEYVVEETDALLYQVVETISTSPETVPVCSYEIRSERKVFSVSHQILEAFVKPTILELQRGLDTTEIHTGLEVEELDTNNELAATTQIASIFEVNDSVSTEILSEVPTEEFDTAEITEDEVQEVDVTHPDSVTELESIDESHYLVECLAEVNATGSTNKLPEGDLIVPDECPLIEAHQTETETPKLDSQETDLAATVADETKDGAMEQEATSLAHKEDQVMHNITDQIQAEDEDQQPVEVEDLQELADVQALTLGSEKGVPSLEKDIISEGIPAGETDTYELKEVPLTEVSVEPEKEDELETDAAKPEHVEVPEASEVEQASTLDSEEGSIQSPKDKVKSEDNLPAETVPDEPKQSAEGLTEVSVEPENKELPANAMKTVQQPENVPEGETDEPKKESILVTEANPEPVDAPKTGHVQEPEVSEAVQAPTLDSEEGSIQSLEKEVISDNVPEGETAIDELKQIAEGLTEVSVESQNKELPANAMKTVQEPEVSEAVQAPTLDSEEGSAQSFEKEEISDHVSERETDEPKEETVPLPEANPEAVDASKTEHVQKPEVLEAVLAPTLDSEEGIVYSFEKQVTSDNVAEGETVIDEPKQTAEGLTEVSVDPENKELPVNVMETVQEPEVSEAVQAPTLDSEEGSVHSLKKEEISQNVPEGETDEPKEETIPLTEENLEPVDASKTEHVQELQSSEDVQAPTLDSEEGSVQSLEKEVISDNVPEEETVIDEPKQTEEGLTKVSVDPENKELPANVMETVQEPEVSEAVQVLTLNSEEGSVQSLEKEVISKNVPEGETDEPKEETIPLPEANPEPVDASNAEHVQELLPSEDVQAPRLDSEEDSVQSPKEEVKSEDIPTAENVIDEPKHTEEGLTKVSVESENKELPANVMETVPEPEVSEAVQVLTLDSEESSVQSLEKEVISEDIPEVETVTDEPKQENEVEQEEKPVEAAKTEHDQEPERLPSDGKDHVTETDTDEGTSMCMHVVTESTEGSSAQEFEKQTLFDEVAKANIDSVIASVTDGVRGEGVAQLGPSLERAEAPKKESITQDVGVEQEQCIPEVGDELLALTEVCVSSVNEDASNVQVLEKTVSTEDTPAPCVDNPAASNEPKHEVQLYAAQVGVEGEKESEFSGTEIKTSAVKHAVVAQVVICEIQDFSVAIPDVLIEKTSPIAEPLMEIVISEQGFKEEVETAAPLVIDDEAETAEEGSVVVMMHVPSVEFEDSNIIQVQVVNDDIESAETIVDTVLEVGITEDKEVIDVCHENVEKVDNLSATLEIEEEIISEKNQALLQKVTQHVKENLPETVPESLVVDLAHEGIEQPDAVTKVSEMVESESSEVEDKKEMADSNGRIPESQDETSTVIGEVAATGKQVTEDLMHPRDITPHLDVSIHDQKDDLEETKAEEEQSETGVAVEEVKSNQTIQKETQMIQTPIVTPTNTGLVDPQNTGAILSIGSVESTSSLSSELQLSIQFGQEIEAASPPPVTERSEPVEKTDVSEVGVQAVEVLEPAKTIKQIKVTEVAVQATGTTELAANLDSKERAVITAQPVLLDIIQAMEPGERVEARERVTSSVQATETMQPASQTEKGEASQSRPALSEAYDRETKAEEPAKQKEEDQDVWLDAEEDVDTQEKRLGPQAEGEREGKAGLEREVEMTPHSKTEEEESQQEMHKTAERRETDSEEDFAVALEHPETEAASVTTMERN